MDVGDRVISKKIGPITTGTIVSKTLVDYFAVISRYHPEELAELKDKHPNSTSVYTVLFDQPVRLYTSDKPYTNEFERMAYLSQPAQTQGIYAEDELELFGY